MRIAFISIGLLFLTACGGNTETKSSETPAAPKAETAPVKSATSDTVDIVMNVGDEMKYDQNRLIVEQGQVVRLKLVHNGTMPKTSMGHNWVLLKNGVNVSDFGMAAASAADNDYIPSNMSQDVIAHTKIIGGGESDTIIFEAPAEGAYEYICSFPGHYGMMKGKLVVM